MASWLLVFIVFDVSNGGLALKTQTTRAYQDEASCNSAGQELFRNAKYADPNLRSLSVCIPRAAFDEGADPQLHLNNGPPSAG